MAQKIIGLDIGAHSVKAVLLSGTLRGWELEAWACEPLGPEVPQQTAAEEAEPPAGGEAAAAAGERPAAEAEEEEAPEVDPRLASAVAAVAQRIGGLRADQLAVALPGTSAASPLVTLPFTDARKIDATLGFEVEGLLPFDIDDALYDYQVLSQRDGKSELLVGVARREDFTALLAELQALGIDPRVITLPGLALEPLALDVARRDGLGPEEHAAILDLGHERGVLTVVRGALDEKNGPAMVFTRTFSGGGADLPGAEGGDLAGDALLRRRALSLVREVRQSLRAAQGRTRQPVLRLHLSGAMARMPGLAELLAAELGIPVAPIALPDAAAARLPAEEQPLYAQALGLALRAQARGGRQLNLRRGAFAYKGDLDYLRGKTSRLVVFAALLALLFAGTFWARLETVKAEEAKLDEALCGVTQRVLGSCETDFNVALSKLQGGNAHTAQIPTASAMEVFSEAVARMPTESGLDFDEIDVTLERMRLQGKVDSFDGVDQVVAGLKQSHCVGEVRRGRVQRTRDDKIEFTLDAAWICGQNAGNAGAGTEG